MSGCNAGVQRFIKERSPQAVYVHCCAHQLNLVLVDVAKGVRPASDFFAHLQALYVFLSASTSHELFLSNQKALGGREVRLKRLLTLVGRAVLTRLLLYCPRILLF